MGHLSTAILIVVFWGTGVEYLEDVVSGKIILAEDRKEFFKNMEKIRRIGEGKI